MSPRHTAASVGEKRMEETAFLLLFTLAIVCFSNLLFDPTDEKLRITPFETSASTRQLE